LNNSEQSDTKGMVDDPDVALMMNFCQGQEDAFVTLYNRYRDRMVNHARRLLNDQTQAEEAAQEVFLKLYQARHSYRPRCRFSTYLFRIATNHCLNLKARVEHRLVQRDSRIEEHALGNDLEQLEVISRAELKEALANALSSLPSKQRAALVLCHYEGLSYREAAEVIAVSESALKSLIFRAREGMIHCLRRWGRADSEVKHAV